MAPKWGSQGCTPQGVPPNGVPERVFLKGSPQSGPPKGSHNVVTQRWSHNSITPGGFPRGHQMKVPSRGGPRFPRVSAPGALPQGFIPPR